MNSKSVTILNQDHVHGMDAIGLAFRRALVSQIHPKMIVALFMPFIIALLGGILLFWFFWSPLTVWFNDYLSQLDVIDNLDRWLLTIGLFSIKLYIIPIMAAALLLPIAGVLGLVIAAIFVMPVVLNHIQSRQYPDVTRNGKNIIAVGTTNAIMVSIIFVLGWLFTMPLWLFPPFALILPIFWWAYIYNKIMRVDAIVEHASPNERKQILKQHSTNSWIIGLILSLINLLPPLWIVLPVFSALVFAHYSLQALRQYRDINAIDVNAIEIN